MLYYSALKGGASRWRTGEVQQEGRVSNGPAFLFESQISCPMDLVAVGHWHDNVLALGNSGLHVGPLERRRRSTGGDAAREPKEPKMLTSNFFLGRSSPF